MECFGNEEVFNLDKNLREKWWQIELLVVLLLPKDIALIKIKGHVKYKDPEFHGNASEEWEAKQAALTNIIAPVITQRREKLFINSQRQVPDLEKRKWEKLGCLLHKDSICHFKDGQLKAPNNLKWNLVNCFMKLHIIAEINWQQYSTIIDGAMLEVLPRVT